MTTDYDDINHKVLEISDLIEEILQDNDIEITAELSDEICDKIFDILEPLADVSGYKDSKYN